jgi:hypothetical protein
MARGFKIDQLVRPEHRQQREAMAVDPMVSIDRLHRWLREKKIRVSRNAIHNWRGDFRAVAADRIRHLRRYLTMRIEAMPIEQLKAVCDQVNALPE